MHEATNSRYLAREVRRQAERVLLKANGFLSTEHTEALDAMTASLQEHMIKQRLGVVRNENKADNHGSDPLKGTAERT